MTVPTSGLNLLIYASIVAFGIAHARQPVQFFGVLPPTGRQLMYGFPRSSRSTSSRPRCGRTASRSVRRCWRAVPTRRMEPGSREALVIGRARPAQVMPGGKGHVPDARRAQVAELSARAAHKISAELVIRCPDGRRRILRIRRATQG
jgi:hypothetical protein